VAGINERIGQKAQHSWRKGVVSLGPVQCDGRDMIFFLVQKRFGRHDVSLCETIIARPFAVTCQPKERLAPRPVWLGAPGRNRTYNLPLGGESYIHLTTGAKKRKYSRHA